MRELLLVEDNRGDVVLFKAAIVSAGLHCRVTVAEDGRDGMDLLLAPPGDGCPGRPDVVVLDLNLPGMSGADVIRRMQADPSLRVIPLVVLTSSQRDQGVLSEWDRGRCLYLIKSPAFHGLVDMVRTIDAFVNYLASAPAKLNCPRIAGPC